MASEPIIGTRWDDVLDGTEGDDEINGRGGNDTLRGLGGNDSLDGWAGADRMEGGTGDDTYFVDDPGDVVIEVPGESGGTDLVNSAVDFTLGNDVENLKLWGSARVGIGNELDNVIVGTSKANELYGLAGDDTIEGGAGNDTFFFSWKGIGLQSSAWRDGYWGYLDWDEHLEDDGSDMLIGGRGSDTYVVPTWSDNAYWEGDNYYSPSVRANLGTGSVEYGSAFFAPDRLVSIENIVTGVGDDRILGSNGDNRIECGGGTNTVLGREGNDVIMGGHSYNEWGRYSPETVRERLNGGKGDDIIDSGGSYWEEGTSRSFDGGLTTDFLSGGSGDDHLIGGLGHIIMSGGRGEDIFEVRSDTYELQDYMGPPYGAIASSVTITDFRPGKGDVLLYMPGTGLIDHDFREWPQKVPDFVGRRADLGYDEVGYQRVRREDGGTDTVISHRYLFHDDTGWDDDGLNVDLTFTVVLENYDRRITENMIEFI